MVLFKRQLNIADLELISPLKIKSDVYNFVYAHDIYG